jgi:hypothetical protein
MNPPITPKQRAREERPEEHSGNIQGTFKEHSGNIQGSFREF